MRNPGSAKEASQAAALDRDAIIRRMRAHDACNLITLRSIDSTNDEAKRRIRAGERMPFLIAADTQTGGRGRLGRSFSSPAGGAYLSIACETGVDDALRLTTLASVAVARVVETLTNLRPAIKWVNDVYLHDKKICGILCEGVTRPAASSLHAVVVGIGLNLRAAALPKPLMDVAGALDTAVPRETFIAEIANAFFALMPVPPAEYMSYYRARSLVIGRAIAYHHQGEAASCTGVALDVLDDGTLVVQNDDNTISELRTGEITLRLTH